MQPVTECLGACNKAPVREGEPETNRDSDCSRALGKPLDQEEREALLRHPPWREEWWRGRALQGGPPRTGDQVHREDQAGGSGYRGRSQFCSQGRQRLRGTRTRADLATVLVLLLRPLRGRFVPTSARRAIRYVARGEIRRTAPAGIRVLGAALAWTQQIAIGDIEQRQGKQQEHRSTGH